MAISTHAPAPRSAQRMMRAALLTALVAKLVGCAATGTHGPESSTGEPCLLRIGTSGDYAPFSIVADSELEGLDIAIGKRLGNDLGCRVVWVRFAWPDLIADIARGNFDLAISGITMRPERALAAGYSRPYARTGVVVMTAAKDSAPSSLAEIGAGLRVAVNHGGHLERWARANLPNAHLRAVDDNLSLPQLLVDGEVDAIVTDTAEAGEWASRGRVLGPFTTDYKAILIGNGGAGLSKRIDDWLVAREKDGVLDRLRRASLADTPASDSEQATLEAFAALAQLRLSLMPMVAAAKATMTKKVTDGAQEERVIDRARAWSARPNARIDEVYRALIELAKRIQRRSNAAHSHPTLQTLRDAIANVDRQIVRELDRLPIRTTEQWRGFLAPLAETLPLETGELEMLAEALSS